MKKLSVLALLFLFSCSINKAADNLTLAQKYVPGTEDLPIYEGFQAIDKKNVVFDSASGRIIEANYFSQNSKIEDVKNFYANSLPELGWKKKTSTQYTRDDEDLKIGILEKKGVIYLNFNISPI